MQGRGAQRGIGNVRNLDDAARELYSAVLTIPAALFPG